MVLATGRPDSLQLIILRSSAHKAFKVLQYGKGRETATKCRGMRDEEQGANLPSFILYIIPPRERIHSPYLGSQIAQTLQLSSASNHGK